MLITVQELETAIRDKCTYLPHGQ